ncbi:MAG TPA: CHAD domain-containing protein [Allosphingosinicella sp.]|nr:CHAD domain-containing protein [Allosphingosinicella sp.]
MAHEVELKFDLEPGGATAIRRAPALTAVRPEKRKLETLYFDTKDGALRRSGYSLRVRQSGGQYVQTVKGKPAASAGLFARREWESQVARFDYDAKAPSAAPLKRLLARAKGKLKPVVRTQFRRTAWLIERDGSRIEVVLDEGKVASGEKEAPLCELELELLSGKPAALFALAEELGEAAALRLGVQTKAERGFALAEKKLGRPAKAEPVRLKPPLTEAGAFQAIASACLRHFRLNEIALRAARDPDALHQARVALRRLRSALSLFRSTLSGEDYREIREELRWLTGQFGEARNLDVLLERYADSKALKAERERAYKLLIAALDGPRARALMLRLSLWIECGAWRYRPRAARDLAGLAFTQLDKQWRKVRRHGGALAALDADAQHQLRLDIKRLRYAAEFLSGLYTGRPLSGRRDRFIAGLKALQEQLGLLNDLRIGATLTRQLAPGLNPSRADDDKAARAAIRAAERAYRQAAAAADYWEPATA